MKTETIDIHFGISWLMDMHEVSERIKSANGTLLSGLKYELFQDEGRDNWQVWGEARESEAEPWHLIVRVEYPDGMTNIDIYHDYLEYEAILGTWLRNLEYEGRQLVAVITDSDDWSTYQGGPVRTVPA